MLDHIENTVKTSETELRRTHAVLIGFLLLITFAIWKSKHSYEAREPYEPHPVAHEIQGLNNKYGQYLGTSHTNYMTDAVGIMSL